MLTERKPSPPKSVAVIGGGPAGLMAAEAAAAGGLQVDVYDAMPSVARKFLQAGVGGMNITHSEPFDAFVARYRERAPQIRTLLEAFSPDDLRAWIHALGIETFIGSSGRVFPREMKAAPLLRAWLHRLRKTGVRIHTRHRWQGWNKEALVFSTDEGELAVHADATVLALGGGSWPRLGSDGSWVPRLRSSGVTVHELLPSNCGFEIGWSEHFSVRHAGAPVKPVVMEFTSHGGDHYRQRGEFIVTKEGIEGGLVYALSAPLRDEIARHGSAIITLDLAPDREESRLREALSRSRGKKSLSEHLRRATGLEGVRAGLLREVMDGNEIGNNELLAARIKRLPLTLLRTRPLDEAISSAGGVAFHSMNDALMLQEIPGVFCAGEMLDWEAPTGGYLLSACFASGRVAGTGALRWLSA